MPKKLRIVSLVVVSIAVWALLLYGFLFFQLVKVPTGAMANTIVPGDHLIVKKRAFGEINRGDIIVFSYDGDPARYLSRVVGLPGERIEIRGRSVYINGAELAEHKVLVKEDLSLELDFLEEVSSSGNGSYRVLYHQVNDANTEDESGYGDAESFEIPDGHYFVMGDNRDNSIDSRSRGPVTRAAIFGKPIRIYWSSHTSRTSHEHRIRWIEYSAALDKAAALSLLIKSSDFAEYNGENIWP